MNGKVDLGTFLRNGKLLKIEGFRVEKTCLLKCQSWPKMGFLKVGIAPKWN